LALFSQGTGSSATGTGSASANAEVSGSSTTAREAAVIVTLSERAKGVMATGSTDSSSGVAAAITAIQDIVKRSKAGGTAGTDSTTATGSSETIWQALDAVYDKTHYSTTQPTSVGSVKTIGTVGTAGWSTTLTDVYTGPANLQDPQQVASWYENPNNIAMAKIDAESSDKDSQDYAKAFANRTLKIQNAYNISGLDYHNSYTYSNNGLGNGETTSVTYNSTPEMLDGKNRFSISGGGEYITW
ncbi:MAG: hypothetical protein P4M00_06955, partial [Azospirillaceae bacterium]|nr:hypothetical protein [Azospirillaceae bacterium]